MKKMFDILFAIAGESTVFIDLLYYIVLIEKIKAVGLGYSNLGDQFKVRQEFAIMPMYPLLHSESNELTKFGLFVPQTEERWATKKGSSVKILAYK